MAQIPRLLGLRFPGAALLSNRRARVLAVALGLLVSMNAQLGASDHADTDILIKANRHDARIADFYVFMRGDNLVLAATYMGKLPPNLDEFRFKRDVAYRFHIDTDPTVRFDDAEAVRLFGGTIGAPHTISEDVVFEIRLGGGKVDDNAVSLSVRGLDPALPLTVSVFAGVRDEPFIRSIVIGNNTPAIVLEVPLDRVSPKRQPMLLWATTDVKGIGSDQDELGGRAYRSMMPEGKELNLLHPREHAKELSGPPDVVIFDPARPASFPNGRDLTDDVVDLLGRPDGEPFPSENDVPFLAAFPYLAPPHRVAAGASK